MRLFTKFALTAAVVAALCSARVSFAAIAAEPNPSTNPVLATIIKSGAKLYYLGGRGGMDGWLIVKDSKVQVIYAAPGGQSAVMGAMFGPGGENVTTQQVQALLATHKDLAAMLVASANQPVSGAPAPLAGAPNAQMAAALAAIQQVTNQTTSAPAPAAVPTVSPGERLMSDLQNAAGVTVGSSAAPLLLMVVDPGCPHCKATWRAIRDPVFKNTLQVRLVPIGTLDSDQEKEAAQLLHTADPLNAWDKFVGGDKSQLAGASDQNLVAAVQANHALIDSWHINATPYLVYRGKDGRVKIVNGEPEQVSDILKDLIL